MEIFEMTHEAFRPYGVLLPGDFAPLAEAMQATPCPAQGTVYVPSDEALEALPLFTRLQDHVFGGLPIQLGYCNGSNHTLNALEYHRGSEVNIACDDVVLLLALATDLEPGPKGSRLNTAAVKAFRLPAGSAALLYETSLHYAPCNAPDQNGFRVAIVLPRGTNTEKPALQPQSAEDSLLWARNKWLLAHPASPEAEAGAYAGLYGENLSV